MVGEGGGALVEPQMVCRIYMEQRRMLLRAVHTTGEERGTSQAQAAPVSVSNRVDPQSAYSILRQQLIQASHRWRPHDECLQRPAKGGRDRDISADTEWVDVAPSEVEGEPVAAPSSGVVGDPTSTSTSSDSVEGQTSASSSSFYLVGGIHHIFHEHSDAITAVAFARENPDLLAAASKDGCVSLCTVLRDPRMLHRLEGHDSGVYDVEFSAQNEYLATASDDHTVRVWKVSSGHCLRILQGDAPFWVLRFHPVNSNILACGDERGLVRLVNVSTGLAICRYATSCAVTAMTFDHTGSCLFVGNSKGRIHVVLLHTVSDARILQNVSLTKVANVTITPAPPPSPSSSGRGQRCCESAAAVPMSFTYTPWLPSLSSPAVLAPCRDQQVRVFSVTSAKPLEAQTSSLDVRSMSSASPSSGSSRDVRQAAPYSGVVGRVRLALDTPEDGRARWDFCARAPCCVGGGADGTVYIVDLLRHRTVTSLSAHSTSVSCAAWSFGENILATGDASGCVILWSRSAQYSRHLRDPCSFTHPLTMTDEDIHTITEESVAE